ncbi:MAG: cysteine--tRNA ligase [bacterium]
MIRPELKRILRFYNTATREKHPFRPIAPPDVCVYSCGPTVYYLPHVGHLRAYLTSDLLHRTLTYAGYHVRHAMNITDVGHMTSDADEGEDKMELGARREGKSPWELARYYEDAFFRAIAEINILRPHIVCRATEHIDVQIQLIQRLEERGYTYRTTVGVIFDTERFPRYADFARLDLSGQTAGARVAIDPERKRPQDFALWITNQPLHLMQWDTPWGRGFPGWHLECSAMAMHYLGEMIDIHTGGIDNIPVHHSNEIAQSEAATGKPFSQCWVHSAFLNVDGQKMSKSLGNLYTVDDVRQRGFSPLALRYLYLGSGYRNAQNFTWEALDGAQRALMNVWGLCAMLPAPNGEPISEYLDAFDQAIADDLNTSQALAVLLQMLHSEYPSETQAMTVAWMDRILGLDLASARLHINNTWRYQGLTPEIEHQARLLLEQRQQARQAKDFALADRLRSEIGQIGYKVEDRDNSSTIAPMYLCER